MNQISDNELSNDLHHATNERTAEAKEHLAVIHADFRPNHAFDKAATQFAFDLRAILHGVHYDFT